MHKFVQIIFILAMGVCGSVATFYMIPTLRQVGGQVVNDTVNSSQYFGFNTAVSVGPLIFILFTICLTIAGVWYVLTHNTENL